MPLLARLLVTLLVTWMLLSGLFKPQLLLLGLASVGLSAWLAVRMRILDHKGQPLYFQLLGLLRYWCWLVAEIIRSNIDVCRLVLSPSMPIRPALRSVAATPHTELGDVIYANSITLTPGTTAINFTPNGDVLVHALHEDSLADLDTGRMADRVRAVEPDLAPLTQGPLRYRRPR